MKKQLFIFSFSIFLVLEIHAQTTTFDNLNANPLTNKAITWISSNHGSGSGHRIINADPGEETLLNFQTRHNTSVWSDLLTLTSLGRVGVGITNPAHELTVYGTSSPNIELKNSNYSNGGFILNRTNYGNQWKWWAESDIMKFSFSNDDTNYSNKLTIKSNGNIGIGSENPSHELVIQGASSPNIELKNSNYSMGVTY